MLSVNGVCISFEEIKELLKSKFNVCCNEINTDYMYEDGWCITIKGDKALADLFSNKKWRNNDGVYSNSCDLAEADSTNKYNSKSAIFDMISKIIDKEVFAYTIGVNLLESLENKVDTFDQIVVFIK